MSVRLSTWQRKVSHAAVPDDELPPLPRWTGEGVPRCTRSCPHNDGLRCTVQAVVPGRVCEPVVAAMALTIALGATP